MTYMKQRKLIKKGFWGIGDKYEDEFIEVKVLGHRLVEYDTGTIVLSLVKLPNGELKEVYREDLFYRGGEIRWEK